MPATSPNRAQPPAPIGGTERGQASWYGEPYHGRRSASGEIFDMEQLTAAHKTLPFQTWVRVENLDNGKKVEVRITDRGPFVDGRIIDLSRAAAREIDMLRSGVAPVELRVIEAPPATRAAEPAFAVQAGAFTSRERAESLRLVLAGKLSGVEIQPSTEGERPFYRVYVGEGLTEAEAIRLAPQVKALTGQQVIVVRVR